MDSIISEMEKLLTSGRENCDIQDIIGESAEKNIDDLLVEADKLISEILPYFQANSNTNTTLNDFDSAKVNSMTLTTQKIKNQRNDTKRVVFNLKTNTQNTKIPEKSSKTSETHGSLATNKYILDKEKNNNNTCSSSLNNCMKPEFKFPDVNTDPMFIQTQLQVPIQVNSTMLDNHNRLQIMCNRYDKLANNLETQTQTSKLKIEEDLNYYKLKNDELEQNLMLKEQEFRNLENQYQQLNHYCESFLKKKAEETLKYYDYQLNQLIERNTTRESQLHAIIIDLLKEIDQSHLHYRIKLSEKNREIRKYLNQIERILNNIYEFRNTNTVG